MKTELSSHKAKQSKPVDNYVHQYLFFVLKLNARNWKWPLEWIVQVESIRGIYIRMNLIISNICGSNILFLKILVHSKRKSSLV